jgi:hypothetical protein
LVLLQKALAAPRKEYSTDFSALFNDGEDHDGYREGLMFLSCLFGGFLLAWGAVLVILKCNGRAVGCASGSAFTFPKNEESDSSLSSISEYDGEQPEEDGRSQHSFRSSIPSEDGDEDGVLTFDDRSIDESVVSTPPNKPTRRERRTQTVFFIFGFLTLVCVPLAHMFVFLPLRESANTSSIYVEDVREVMAEVDSSVIAISTGVQQAFGILENVPLTEMEVCPQATSNQIQSVLGFRIEAMISVYVSDYGPVEAQVSENVNEVTKILNIFTDALEIIEKTAHETETYIWVVPGILVGLSVVTAIALFGAFLSRKRDSNRRFQRFLAYFILPFLIATSLVCWLVATAAATTTAVWSDACMSGSSNGSPAATIHAILAAKEVDPDSILRKFISAYSLGCQGNDPATTLSELQSEVHAIVETIWQYLLAVDSAGRSSLEGICGEGNQITPFLAGFRDLAKQLTSVSRALESASASLSCSRIHEIYDDAINQSLCNDVASASALGFLIFFVIGITTMTMITLRASWFHEIDEDKIYDESEVAENMIVDEHEEYLAYISKYKQEWEEYGGFETTLAQPQTMPNSLADSEVYGFSAASQETPNEDDIAELVPDTKEEAFDPYSDIESPSTMNSEDISFLSFTGLGTPSNAQSRRNGSVLVPPPLLQRRTSIDLDDMESLPPPIAPPAKNEVTYDFKKHGKTVSPAASTPNSSSLPARESLKSFGGKGQKYTSEKTTMARRKFSNSNAEDIYAALDNIENLVSTTGESIDLKPPPTFKRGSISSPARASPVCASPARASPGSVSFKLADGPSPTLVQERVDRFSKTTSKARPLTPTRGQNSKTWDLALKFDSPYHH